jgi:hypothetical protein
LCSASNQFFQFLAGIRIQDDGRGSSHTRYTKQGLISYSIYDGLD